MAFLSITRKKTPQAETPEEWIEVPDGTLAISAAAAEAILEKATHEKKEGCYFRVGIVGGGCSGLSYHFAFEENVRPTDKVFEKEGIKVCVDPKSLAMIGGSLLHWQESGMRKEFVLKGKKASKNCSCGKSFSL